MAKALQKQRFEIVPLIVQSEPVSLQPFHRRILTRLRAERRQRTPESIRKRIEDTLPQRTRRVLIRQIERRSQIIQQRLDTTLAQGHQLDALFGCCISSTLYTLQTQLPIIYFSDATTYITRDNYAALKSRSSIHIETLHKIEQTSVERAQAAIFASPVARDSAVHDLLIDQHRTHVVPMGAHVTPDNPASIQAPASPPSRQDCQLLIVAADPVRKRVDLTISATEILRNRGINAKLHIIGPPTESGTKNKTTQTYGRLRLSDPRDRQTHQQLLRNCHIQLLPSLGEAFGIAPIESAHFARPSIVSDAGGLPFVVQHERTGLVINRDANPAIWADAIESLIDSPDQYRAMSTAALKRARGELNWDSWGRSVGQIIVQTINEHR